MAHHELGERDVWKAIENVRIAMLTTDDHGELVSRPMASLALPDDGCVYFVTRMNTKVGEIGKAARVNLAYADTQETAAGSY